MSQCPDYPTRCRIPGATQRPLDDSERRKLTAAAAAAAAKAGGAWVCGYCGLVYSQQRSVIRLGYLVLSFFRPFYGWE